MIRIRTRIGDRSVSTLFSPELNRWITIVSIPDLNGKIRTSSIDGSDFYQAGQNHLAACKRQL